MNPNRKNKNRILLYKYGIRLNVFVKGKDGEKHFGAHAISNGSRKGWENNFLDLYI